MKIDFSFQLLGLNGKPAVFQDSTDPASTTLKMTLGKVAGFSLVSLTAKSGIEKEINGSLAMKVFGGGKVDVSSEEFSKIKEAIGDIQSSIVVAQAWNYLEKHFKKDDYAKT